MPSSRINIEPINKKCIHRLKADIDHLKAVWLAVDAELVEPPKAPFGTPLYRFKYPYTICLEDKFYFREQYTSGQFNVENINEARVKALELCVEEILRRLNYEDLRGLNYWKIGIVSNEKFFLDEIEKQSKEVELASPFEELKSFYKVDLIEVGKDDMKEVLAGVECGVKWN